MAAKKAAPRGRPRKVNQENLAKLAAEQAAADNCTCAEHDDHDDCSSDCDCFDGQAEPQVIGSIPYSVPLSTVMGQEEAKAKKKGPLSLREKYQRSKDQGRIGDNGLILMSVWRLPIFSQDGTVGIQAEQEFCFRMHVALDFIEQENYMPLLQQRGPGAYRVTLRDTKGVMDDLQVHVAKPATAPQIVTDPATGAQTTIYYQQPNGTATAAEPVKVPTLKESLKDMVEQKRYLKELMDDGQPAAPAQAPAPVFDAATIQAEILKTKAFAEGIAGILNPGHTGKKSVMELMFEHGADLMEGLGKHIVNPIIGAIERRQQHEPAQMDPSQVAQSRQIQNAGPQSNGMDEVAQNPQGEAQPGAGGGAINEATPEVQIMNYCVNAYLSRVPMRALIGNLRGMAEMNPGLPDMLGGFAEESIENVQQFVAFIRPDLREEIVKPEAAAWLKDLQAAINKEWPREEEES